MAATDASRLGELLADELAYDRAVGAAGDLRHDVGHYPPEVPHARGADLGDGAVHDLLQLLLVELLRHELREHGQLRLLGGGLLRPPAGAKRLRSLHSSLPLALENLELLVVVERPLELLLRPTQAGQEQPQRIAPLDVPRAHRLLQLALQTLDQAHSGIPATCPPRTCQWRWKIVCPAPAPTLTSTR